MYVCTKQTKLVYFNYDLVSMNTWHPLHLVKRAQVQPRVFYYCHSATLTSLKQRVAYCLSSSKLPIANSRLTMYMKFLCRLDKVSIVGV